ncbi:MAG: hypothetical protein EAX87_09380 [Candidatus Thorarchaeota archaeon]|nr:hypothetical protein [Candidatus Thorarchaeota archaeon]
MNEIVSGNQHSFKVVLPKRVSDHTDGELRLMLVTLKNAIVASSVHISKIEHELKKRNANPRILSGPRLELLSGIEIDEDIGDIEWETQLNEDNSVAT